MNRAAEMASVTGVACSALLGIWWVIFICWVVVLIMWIKALVSYNKCYREYEQCRREHYQATGEVKKPASELDKGGSLTFQLLRRLRLIHGYKKLDASHHGALDGVGSRAAGKMVHTRDKPLNLGLGSVVHKSKNAKMPNESSSATATTHAAAAGQNQKDENAK